jgi:heme/copper-type cytochrome/quinol oxidase subunit 3
VDGSVMFYLALGSACVLTLAGTVAMLAGPHFSGLDPTAHVYAAIVWMLAIWVALHGVVGFIMQVFCFAGRAFGRLTPHHDIDIWNVTLFWHFVAVTVVITVAVIAGFPLVR